MAGFTFEWPTFPEQYLNVGNLPTGTDNNGISQTGTATQAGQQNSWLNLVQTLTSGFISSLPYWLGNPNAPATTAKPSTTTGTIPETPASPGTTTQTYLLIAAGVVLLGVLGLLIFRKAK